MSIQASTATILRLCKKMHLPDSSKLKFVLRSQATAEADPEKTGDITIKMLPADVFAGTQNTGFRPVLEGAGRKTGML